MTGANGFVGSAVRTALLEEGFTVRAMVRTPDKLCLDKFAGEIVSVGDMESTTEWRSALAGVDTIVHLAGRAHVLKESSRDPLGEFRRVNVLGTQRLAREAVRSEVRRVVYLSSIGVHGRITSKDSFTESSPVSPHNDYTLSKWEAEQTLRELAAHSDLEVVVLRSPLVYGPEAKANFLRLMSVVDRRIPLPLGSVRNQRSFIYVGNLADAIVTCVDSSRAAGETFLVSDGEDVSTPELIKRVARAIHRPCFLPPVPPRLLRALGCVSGKSQIIEPLLDSLVVDSSKIRRVFDWESPYTMTQGLDDAAAWFRNTRSQNRTRYN